MHSQDDELPELPNNVAVTCYQNNIIPGLPERFRIDNIIIEFPPYLPVYNRDFDGDVSH